MDKLVTQMDHEHRNEKWAVTTHNMDYSSKTQREQKIQSVYNYTDIDFSNTQNWQA